MVMKKIIFLLLLAQTISFLYADSGCIGYTKYQGAEGAVAASPTDWRWGTKAPSHQECYCNCAQYTKGNYKCPGCGHRGIPKDMKLAADSKSKVVSTKLTVKKADHKKKSSAHRKHEEKRKTAAKKEKNKKKAQAKKQTEKAKRKAKDQKQFTA